MGKQLLALMFLALWTAVAHAAPEGPAWKELNESEQQILAPLKTEWPSFDAVHKRKWVGIADRYPQLSLYQQWQLKNRIQEWAKLSPEQREAARARYKEFEQLPPERKENVRQQYEIKQMTGPPESAPATNR